MNQHKLWTNWLHIVIPIQDLQLLGKIFFENAPDSTDFPSDVRGRTVVVSIEPFSDNDPVPFLLKPLLGTAGHETATVTHDLSLNATSFPSGMVIR